MLPDTSVRSIAANLEQLRLRLRAIQREEISLDGYDRWGAADDADREVARGRQLALAVQRGEVTQGLLATLQAAKIQDPAGISAIRYWATAVQDLLDLVIAAGVGADRLSNARIAAGIASRERARWEEVKAWAEDPGPEPLANPVFLDENAHYIHLDPERHRHWFGDADPLVLAR